MQHFQSSRQEVTQEKGETSATRGKKGAGRDVRVRHPWFALRLPVEKKDERRARMPVERGEGIGPPFSL